jgi:hypothetical protein
MRHRFNCGVVVALAALLAACGSSGRPTGANASSTTAVQSSSTTTTVHVVTTTTTRPVNPAVADQFTQLSLSSALQAAHSIYLHSYDYTAITPASLGPLVPTLHFGAINQTGKNIVGVLAQDRNDVLLAARSASGRWYCIIENATDGISYGEGSKLADVDSNGECQQAAWPPPGKDANPF